MKIGIGYDVHKLKKGAKFIVGGVKIQSDYGCISHSDGDALTHAVIDSIYSFTPSDTSSCSYFFHCYPVTGMIR